MAVRTISPSGRRRGVASRASFRVLVFHAGPGVKAHVAPIARNQRFRVTCYPQGTVPIRRPATGVDAVLWQLSPGRRPNWRRLNALARGVPVLSYSADSNDEVVSRSVELGFGRSPDRTAGRRRIGAPHRGRVSGRPGHASPHVADDAATLPSTHRRDSRTTAVGPRIARPIRRRRRVGGTSSGLAASPQLGGCDARAVG